MQTKTIDHLLDITDKAVAAGSVFDIKHHSSLCKFKVNVCPSDRHTGGSVKNG